MPSFCVASVALGDICLRFVWQAWHLRHCVGTALVGAGVLWRRASFAWQAWHLGTCLRFVWQAWRLLICLRFVWQAWHLRHWVGSGDGLGRRWCPVVPRLFCVAGVALGDVCFRFVWQAWHLVTSAFVLCGRRGTYGTGLALVTALVGAGVLWRRASFAWQAWRWVTSAFVLCVVLGDIYLHFVWHAWHLRHWTGSGDGLGRRSVCVTPRLFCVAGVALGDICLRVVWQAWRLATSVFTLCGKRGTHGAGLARVAALVGAGSA
eukprot:s471_g29.t1